MTIKWYLGEMKLPNSERYEQEGSNLTIKDIRKTDNGKNITCRAEETSALTSDPSSAFVIFLECKYIINLLFLLFYY